MRKKVLVRMAIGFPSGIALGHLITIWISWIIGDGLFYPIVPSLQAVCGSEIAAVGLQALLSGLMGAACGASSIIWEVERWSLLKQTILHYAALSMSILPVAFTLHWMEHSVAGVMQYLLIFAGMYVVIWAGMTLALKSKIKKLNAKLHEQE